MSKKECEIKAVLDRYDASTPTRRRAVADEMDKILKISKLKDRIDAPMGTGLRLDLAMDACV